MKAPKVIMHNSISLDGAVSGFEVNMELHYRLAGEYKADIHLIGSNTIIAGLQLYGTEIPPEDKSHFLKPEKDPGLPLWVIPDTKGILKGILHYLRMTEFCRDVVILISEKTNKEYIDYLEERNYYYHVCGEKFVDYRKAIDILKVNYGAQIIMIDAGPTLNNILLQNNLIDVITLLVMPCIIDKKFPKVFSKINLGNKNINLELLKCSDLGQNIVLLSYKVSGKSTLA